MNSSDSLILVTGAGGFIGKSVVARLLAQGWRVRAMARSAGGPSIEPHERLHTVRADMKDAESLILAVQNVSAVVHLAAAKADESDSDEVNVGGASRLVAACHAAGCRRLVNISTQSVRIARKGTYARTKGEADAVFRNSGLGVTTLLPSVIYGAEGSGAFDAILTFVRRLPVVPVLGDGKWLSAPIHVDDVSNAIIACLNNDETVGREYDLGGPELIAFDDLIDRIGAAIGIHRRKIHVPLQVSLWAARSLAFLPKPPVTVSNVLGSNQDTRIDISSARRDLQFNPMDLTKGLEMTLRSSSQMVTHGLRNGAGAQTDGALALDCALISRYLLEREPTPELVKRYCEAWHHFHSLGQVVEEPEWRWIRRHPWALKFLDAATAILRPDSSVRKQLYIMTALLEATSTNSDFYLRPPGGPVRALTELIWQGCRCAAKVSVGIPLFYWARLS